MARTNFLNWGEPAPWFAAPTTSTPNFRFDSLAGRWVVLCFFESAARPDSLRILHDFLAREALFDDRRASFTGVSVDPTDQAQQRVSGRLPGIRFFWDFDRAISRLYAAVGNDGVTGYRRHTLLLDQRLRGIAVVPFDSAPEAHAARILDFLSRQPPPPPVPAPVLVVPRVFEPELCQALIRYYNERGGQESGFAQEVGGKTVLRSDPNFKRRRDQSIEDQELCQACSIRIRDRLVPEIHKAFQFRATQIERYIVACYDSSTGGFFRPHRDNTNRGSEHRRFAVSLNLNTGEYEGGNLRFPEFGPQEYVPPLGGAVVFSCSLLHEATPVTRGKRYAFLPFLHDDDAERIRRQNLSFVGVGSFVEGVASE